MIVRARYAAPYRHVPVGHRRERYEILSGRVDADIPEVSPEAFLALPVGERGTGPRLYARDGQLWERLTEPNGRDGARFDLGRAAVLDFIDGTAPGRSSIERRLRRTPLVAVFNYMGARRIRESWPTRGVAGEPRSRVVVSDTRERAARAAARFLTRDVALAGDAAFVRCDPVAELQIQDILMILPAPHAGHESGQVRSIRDRFGRGGGPVKVIPEVQALLDALSDDAGTGAEARAIANSMACEALLDIEGIAACGPGDMGGLADIAVRLRPHADMGAIGSIPEVDVPEALALVAEAARLLASDARTVRNKVDWAAIDEHLRSGAVTGIGVRDGDADALEGLAP